MLNLNALVFNQKKNCIDMNVDDMAEKKLVLDMEEARFVEKSKLVA